MTQSSDSNLSIDTEDDDSISLPLNRRVLALFNGAAQVDESAPLSQRPQSSDGRTFPLKIETAKIQQQQQAELRRLKKRQKRERATQRKLNWSRLNPQELHNPQAGATPLRPLSNFVVPTVPFRPLNSCYPLLPAPLPYYQPVAYGYAFNPYAATLPYYQSMTQNFSVHNTPPQKLYTDFASAGKRLFSECKKCLENSANELTEQFTEMVLENKEKTPSRSSTPRQSRVLPILASAKMGNDGVSATGGIKKESNATITPIAKVTKFCYAIILFL